jgi:hypothetical protein
MLMFQMWTIGEKIIFFFFGEKFMRCDVMEKKRLEEKDCVDDRVLGLKDWTSMRVAVVRELKSAMQAVEILTVQLDFIDGVVRGFEDSVDSRSGDFVERT